MIPIGKQKKGNPNAQRNNNAKKMSERHENPDFANEK